MACVYSAPVAWNPTAVDTESEHLELLAATQAYLMDTYRIAMLAWFNE